MMNKFFKLGLAGLVAAGLSASPATAQEALKIGALMPLTGSLQAFGETALNGIRLAVEEINAAGGVLGQPIALAVADDQGSPQAGVDAAQRLISVERSHAIIGAMSSGITIPVARSVTAPAQVPQISNASTSPVLTTLEDNDFLFRTLASDAFQGVAMAQVAQEKGFSTVGIIYINNDYGQGLAESFQEAFEAAGGKVTSSAPYAEKQASFRGELQRASQGRPDALILIAYPGDGIPILRQALEGGFFQRFVFSDGMRAPEVVQAIGGDILEGMGGTAPEAPEGSASAQTFAEAYNARFGEMPTRPYIDTAYDATYVLALAAQKAGSVNGVAIRDALRDVANAPGVEIGPGQWAQALEALNQGQDVNYTGASGSVEFDEAGDVTGTFAHWEIQNGEIVTIKIFEPDAQ